MTTAVATMPSSISSGSTDHRRSDSEAGPRGFTAVNITPPQSRESSATSPDVSPRHGTASAGRHGTSSSFYMNSHEAAQHKRKRSTSSDQGPPSPRRYDYHPPKKVDAQQQQHMADRALHVLDATNPHSHHSYYSTTPAGQDRPGYPYERSYSGPNGVHATTPEGRLAEAFSREPSEHHYASSANGVDHDKMDDGNDKQSSMQSGQKRKRNFSNRTKTGCITCRSRKKKCDEGRPHCNNCLRGGFTCHGYNQTRPPNWSKPIPQKQPVPLQSKENDEPGAFENTTPISANPSSADASQMRPNVAGDGHDSARPQYAPNSATSAESRPPYPGQQQQQPQWPQHPPHGPSPQNSYPTEHLPPLSELARPESQQQQQHYQRPAYSTTPSREMSRPSTQAHSAGPPPTAVSGQNQWQQQPPPQPQPPPQAQPQPQPQYSSAPPQQQYGSRPNPYPPPIDTKQPQHSSAARIHTANTASASLSSYEKAGSKVFLTEDVERSRMLRGAPYNYFDPTLKNERQRCANALLRYNNACQLGSGISETETQSMLMKVFDPKQDSTHSFAAPCRIEGHLGPGVKIEPGFRCTYGYNIRVFDNVFIGEHTRIDDSARVDIGARTWIGANVTILTNSPAHDMVQRKGTDGQQCCTASPVTIGSEVVIGAGAVIYPGVKLGRGSTIEPFAIVKVSLDDYDTQFAPLGQRSGVMGRGY